MESHISGVKVINLKVGSVAPAFSNVFHHFSKLVTSSYVEEFGQTLHQLGIP